MAAVDLQDALDHLQDRNVDAAISTLERTVEALPGHLAAHVLLGRAYEAAGRWTDALRAWETARVLMPNGPVAREGKARVLRRMEERGDEAPAGLALDAETTPADAPPGDPEDTAAEPDAEPSEDAGSPSELEELRQRAEAEARQGGARPGLAVQDLDESPPGTSDEPDAGADTPEERVQQVADEDGVDELDRLIDELESARIEPSPGPADAPAPDPDDEVDDLVSETLARIYETQDEYRKAAQVYVKLASQEPNQAREYLTRAAKMRERAEAATTANEGN